MIATDATMSVRDVLAIRPFRALWFAQICSMFALNTLLFLLALVVYQNTKSNTAVSGIFLAYGIPAVLFGLISGVIVDRLDRRIVLIVCDISRAILAASLIFFSENTTLVYLFLFCHALINQFYVPAEAPTIPKLVPKNLLVTANSLFSFTYYGSMAIGFVLAGPVLRIFGPRGSLVVVSSLFVLAALNVRRIPAQGEGIASLRKIASHSLRYLFGRIASGLSESIRYVKKTEVLFDALVLLTATQVVIAVLGTLGPGFADTLLRIDVRDASVVIIGPVVIGIIVGALWVGSSGPRVVPEQLTRIGILSAGILLCFIAITVRLAHLHLFGLSSPAVLLPIVVALFFLLGVSNSFLDVPSNTTLQRQAEEEMRGKVYGLLATAVGGVGILPVVAGGVLADRIGVGKVILLLGLVILIYGIYRMRYNKLSVLRKS